MKPSGSKLWCYKYRLNGKQMSLALGTYPVTGLKDARKVERRGRLETAHRLRSFAGRVFGYAIWTSRAKTDPTAMISALRTPKVTNNAAIVEAKPLGSFMRELDAFEGAHPLPFGTSPHGSLRSSSDPME
ncbi:MAG: Arm DNA-binding domain-containing protein [Asticcacaulis sp.]|nr:Arm DNA-binding domain-containing protein [Asticcacaulis sp.]